MKNPYEQGVANHSAPSLARQVARPTVKRKQGKRWAGYGASKTCNQDADALRSVEGKMSQGRQRESLGSPA